MATSKPKLHSSHLNMLYRCGEQFYRVYLLGHKEPPGFAQIVGRGTHKSAQIDLTNKMENDVLLPDEQIAEVARDAFVEAWQESAIILTPEQKNLGLEKLKGQGIDETVALALLHHNILAPQLRPKKGGIERPWVIKCEGYPFDLAGQLDLQEEYTIDTDQGPRMFSTIRDLKTLKTKPGQDMADTNIGLTFYTMAQVVLDGTYPDRVFLDCLIKGEDPRLVSIESRRDKNDMIVAKNRFGRACEIIEKEVFTPASPSDWWCSPKFCGFAFDGSCPFYKKRPKLYSTVIQKQTGGNNERRKTRKQVIDAGSVEWWDVVR